MPGKLVSRMSERSCFTLSETDTIKTASQSFHEKKVGCMPILDKDNFVVGIISERDLSRLIYTEKFNSSPVSYQQNDLVYIPYLNMMEADKVIKKGYDVVFGSNLKNNFDKEATELKCKYIWKNNTIVKLKY